MGLGLIPIYMSVVVIALCGLMFLVACAMMIASKTHRAGRQLLRVSGTALLAGILFAWLGFIPYEILRHFLRDRLAILALWASGPAGVVFAIAWHCVGLPTKRSHSKKTGHGVSWDDKNVI